MSTRIPLLAALALGTLVAGAAQPPAHLVVCGWDEVFVIDPGAPPAADGAVRKLWSWRAKDRDDLAEPARKLFNTTDDCKPIGSDGSRILITSSGGGAALVERPSGKVIWHARVPNAHSIELLPKDRVVAASSTHADGNKLVLFDLAKPDQPLWSTPLVSAHGVVWDAGRERLWALGLDELRCYRLKDWEAAGPSLDLERSYPLPDPGGHDLQPVPGTQDLVVTSGKRVHLFDRDKRTFRPHPVLGDREHVKCVSTHPATGRVVYTHGEGNTWWTDTLRFLAPPAELKLADHKLYKARWLPVSGKEDAPPK